MLGREHFEVDRDAGKSQVTSKHESESQAQWFVPVDSGRAWILLGSRKSPKPKKCLKMPQTPTRQVHAVLGGFWQLMLLGKYEESQ